MKNDETRDPAASLGSATGLYEFFSDGGKVVDRERLLDSLTPSQRKAIAFLIRATEECGDYTWNGEDSVWCDDARRTLEVAADVFDVCDPDSF
jgi:hypothetical protein